MNRTRFFNFIFSKITAMVLVITIVSAPLCVYAETDKNEMVGKVYEFDKDNNYEFEATEKSTASDKTETYGKFSVLGDISNISNKDGVPFYEIDKGNLEIYYTYSDTILNAEEDAWHLIEDKGKNIGNKKLDKKIQKGAIILQVSKDRKNWTDVKSVTNAFSDVPIKTDSLYKTTDVELLNGCYYRLIVAYEMCKLAETNKVLFVSVKNYEYKKIAEVYEFYACNKLKEEDLSLSEQTYALGEKIKAKNFEGYSEYSEIKNDDIHYGWDIGTFYVSGYTDKVKDSNGNVVFLKNVGDTVTLWFNLKQDINKLNGQDNLKITADTDGYDQYFETPKMNFGKGALIIRHTDYNNKSSKPQIYTNYLEANASVGADTKVNLFEEGDYEIALDYEVTSDEFVDKIGHYRIYFTYSVRNGNCMVYPLDVETGSELTSSSIVEKGFTLDFAKSRYLHINVKREILSDSADGLVEDVRSNGPAKDGAEYVAEGIYTITATNKYTNQTTTKRIYVGSNNILKAHMTTGLSIDEINRLVSDGATIDNEGIIALSVISETESNSSQSTIQETENKRENKNTYLIVIVIALVILILIATFIYKKRKRVQPFEIEEVLE